MGHSQTGDWAVPRVGPLMGRRFPERAQRRRRRRQAQAQTGKPFRQYRQALTGVRFPCAPQDEVIGKAPEKAAPLHAWLSGPLAPFIQDLMEEEMRSDGCPDAAWWDACLRMSPNVFFHAPGVPPLPHQPLTPPILPPLAPPLASPGLVHTVAVSTDRCIHHPAHALVQAPLAACVPRLMRAATLPKALGAVVQVLRVDRCHPPRHRALDHLVLTRRLAERALAPICLVEPDALSRWGLGAPTAEALGQGTPGLGAGLGIRVRWHPLEPCGARLARLALRLPETVLVAQLGQGRADPLWLLGGLRRTALAVWWDGWGSPRLSRRSVQPLVLPGVAVPPVGPVGLRSPPAPGLGAAQTATMPLAGRFAWRSLPDPLACCRGVRGVPCGLVAGCKPPRPAKAWGHPVPRAGIDARRPRALPRSHAPPLHACPALRPRWCPGGVPCRPQDCGLPAPGHRRLSPPYLLRPRLLSTTFLVSGLHHAASLLAPPGSIHPLAGRHAGALLTCWRGFAQVGLAP
jgi:hypothetical protein